ncbi:uncharacterized protein LOC107616553 [Arachis ipaensis]|uniref:uncharacterized protein LOC107616553 n=1 Tax=Arachis ipaensis TaxID=130454 RepID=UPI0007AF1640|nr:uncharacterized protein LOC107616553 [Arachis ipaensis]
MASISQGIVFTTAMVLSSTVLYLAFSRHKIHHHSPQSNNQILRSCLSSEEKKRERKLSKKKKKRVQFAENVKERIGKSEEEQRKQNRVSSRSSNCRNVREMPANRIALYNGILRDRVHRMECSY